MEQGKTMVKKAYYGVLDESPNQDDLFAGTSKREIGIPAARHQFEVVGVEYHQPDVSKVSCTVFASVTALSNNVIGDDLPIEEIGKYWAEAVRRGANPSVPDGGWSLASAAKMVAELHNRKEGASQVVMLTVDMLDQVRVMEILKKGYLIATGYRGNKAFNDDLADGQLDGINFGSTTFGHAVTLTWSTKAKRVEMIDNYIKTKKEKNVAYVFEANLSSLIRNGIFFRWGYIFVNKADYEAVNAINYFTIAEWASEAIDKFEKNGRTLNGLNPELQITPEIAEDIFYQLGIFTTKKGNCSVQRLVTGLYRLQAF